MNRQGFCGVTLTDAERRELANDVWQLTPYRTHQVTSPQDRQGGWLEYGLTFDHPATSVPPDDDPLMGEGFRNLRRLLAHATKGYDVKNLRLSLRCDRRITGAR